MLTEREKATRCLIFDSFCKAVLRNELRNYYKKDARVQESELASEDPSEYASVESLQWDDYPSDHLFVLYDEQRYLLDNETLCRAMQALPQSQLGVLILDFWRGWSDKRIAELYGVSDRTIRNLRNRAFREIRGWFEDRTN